MKRNGRHEWTLAEWHAPAPPDKISRDQEWRIAPLAKQEDFECCFLAKFGMSLKTIAHFTRLTEGQVAVRLKKFGIRVRDFREGKGHYAELLFRSAVAARASRDLVGELRMQQLNDAAIEI